ncbi:MAG: ATP-binding cassette, subfamily bacterial [Candidatus Binatota bacterium]|nr:ATP-binding cassette, subfamily bacterial [Candidatus Binatota bacterium]
MPFVAPFFPRLLLTFLLSLFGVALGLLWPVFTKILIDDVLLGKNLRLLFVLSGCMVAATAVGYGIGALGRWEYTRVTARILFHLREHLFSHLQNLSLRFHARARLGDLLSRLDTDIAEVQSVLTDAAFTFVSNLLLLAGTIGLLLWLEWRLFFATIVLLPLQLSGVLWIRPRLVEQARIVRETTAGISSFLVESLSAVRFVKLLAIEDLQLSRLGDLGRRFVPIVTRYEMLSYLGSTSVSAAGFLAATVTTLYGGYLVITGEMTVGALIAFSAYQSRAFSPLQVLMGLYLRIERSSVSLGRIFEFLDAAEEYREPRGGSLRLAYLRGEIEFRRVSFAYVPGEPVLCELDFHLAAGGRLVVLGPSGSGKTTIMDLLARLWEPTAGTILVDGHDVREFDVGWLRGRMAVLGPEPFLVHASLLENVRYAHPQASAAEIDAAIATVGLERFVRDLPQGLESPLGEHGVGLSTGQRQRLALARAILRKPQILVFDEALSGLDVEGESNVWSALRRALPGCTTILATHRLTSLQRDDRVLVLDRGRITWNGLFRDLSSAAAHVRSFLERPEVSDRHGTRSAP